MSGLKFKALNQSRLNLDLFHHDNALLMLKVMSVSLWNEKFHSSQVQINQAECFHPESFLSL